MGSATLRAPCLRDRPPCVIDSGTGFLKCGLAGPPAAATHGRHRRRLPAADSLASPLDSRPPRPLACRRRCPPVCRAHRAWPARQHQRASSSSGAARRPRLQHRQRGAGSPGCGADLSDAWRCDLRLRRMGTHHAQRHLQTPPHLSRRLRFCAHRATPEYARKPRIHREGAGWLHRRLIDHVPGLGAGSRGSFWGHLKAGGWQLPACQLSVPSPSPSFASPFPPHPASCRRK